MAKREGIFGFLQGALFDNWKNKGVGLLLAVLIWFYAFGSTLEKQVFTPEVQIKIVESQAKQYAIDKLEVLQGAPRAREELDPRNPSFSVSLRLEGPRKFLEDASDSKLQPVLEVRKDNTEYDLLEDLVVGGLPQGVTLVDTDPLRLRVTLEKIEKRPLPIQWENRWSGTPDRRFTSSPTIDLKPKFLEVEGPISAFEDAKVSIEVQNIQDLRESVVRQVSVILDGPDPRLRPAEGQPATVEARIVLEDATETEDFKVDVLFAIPPREDPVKVEAPRDVVLRFRGTRSDLELLREQINNKANPFHLLYLVKDVNVEKPFRILPSEFRWPHGVAPAGIEIVDFGDGGSTSYVAQLQRSQEEQQ